MSAEHGLEAILLQQATVSADGSSTGVDSNALDGIVTVVATGSAGGAGASNAITIEHSDTQGGTYAAIPGAAIAQGANAAISDAQRVVQFDINGLNKWIRVTHDVTGTYSSAFSAVLLGRKK
jgi:hypothetical protein